MLYEGTNSKQTPRVEEHVEHGLKFLMYFLHGLRQRLQH